VIVTDWDAVGQYDGLAVSPAWFLCAAPEQEGWIWLRATGDLPACRVATPKGLPPASTAPARADLDEACR
jgi:hypothetical protein